MQGLLRWRFWAWLAVSFTFFYLFAQSAFGAYLYMDPSQAEIHPGDTMSVAVRLDTDTGECVNAIDAVIEYDPSIQPVDISRGRSIFPLWVEEPTIDRANNRITFAGGIPNGYCGRIQGDPRLTNVILDIIFQAPGLRIGFGDVGPTSTVRFSDMSTVYLNDGEGTPAPLGSTGSDIFIHKRPGAEVKNEWGALVSADDAPPQEFSVTLNQDDVAFSGKYFIVFNTTDKQTGIAYYEVIEEPIDDFWSFAWGRADAPWETTRSPYVLKDQSLNSIIRVKAVDKAGNEYIATLIPEESLRSISQRQMVVYSAIAAAGVLMLLVIFAGVRLRRKRQQLAVVSEVEVSGESHE